MSEESQAAPAAETPVTETVAATTEAPSFLDSLPEDIRGDASLANFKDSAGLAKSYLESRKLIGNSIRIPSEDSSEEVRADFMNKLQNVEGVIKMPGSDDVEGLSNLYNKLGRPEAHTDYKLEEGISTKPEEFSAFSEIAHKAGMSNEQMNLVMKFDQQRQQQQLEAHNLSVDAGEKVLKEKWGNDYQARLEGAQAAAKTYAETYPEAMKELVDGPAGNNPALLAMLSELQGTMVEKGTAGNIASKPYGTSSEEAKFKISEIMDPSNSKHPYQDGAHPKHNEALKKMAELQELAYPSKR